MPFDRSFPLCALALVSLLGVPAAEGAGLAAEEPDRGPLKVQDPFLLTQGLLTMGLEGATTLPEGRIALEVQHTYSNTFVKSGFEELLNNRMPRAPLTLEELRTVADTTEEPAIYLVDGELSRWDLTVRYGAGSRSELWLTLPWLEVDGGRTDGAVESFHTALGLSQNQRNTLAKDQLTVFLRSRGADVERTSPVGYSLGDAVAGIKVRVLPRGGRRNLAVVGKLKIPTGRRSALFSSGSMDYGLTVVGDLALGAGRLHGSLGASSLGGWRELDISARTLISGGLAYERGVGARWDLIVQLDASQSPFDSRWGKELSSQVFLGSIGGRRALSGGRSFFVAFTENLFNFDNGADFGLHFGLRQRL